jgi:tight adherence protein B
VRRRAVTLLLAGVAAGVVPVASASANVPVLAETAGAHFPDRAYALTLPKARALTAADVEVRENGRPVRDVSVTLASGATARRFGVVLAIDTSTSMRGEPLHSAVAAAREFVRHRSPDQPVAVIAFARTADVLLPFSTDPAAIEEALAAVPKAGGGTQLMPAVARAIELIRAAGMTSASAVVLSDGADGRTDVTVDQVTDAAHAANVRVYGVGLASDNEDFGALNLLAARTGAEFSAVTSPSDLARVYGRLGSRLGHQYIVQYHSAAAPARRVEVEVRVEGVPGVASTAYDSPAVGPKASLPFHHDPQGRLWLSPAAGTAIALGVAGLLFLALWALLRPRGGSLRERMALYVEPPEETAKAGHATGPLTSRVLSSAERSLDGREWWNRFEEALDVARIGTPPVRLLAWVVLGTGMALGLFPMLGGSPVFAALALAVPVAVWRFVGFRLRRERAKFTEQMPDNLQVIASAMRAGHSFGGALAVVVEDAAEPTRRELQRVLADERLGVPIDNALAGAVKRMDNKDLEQVALVAALQRETGGNTAEVLDRVTETVRERLAIRRLVSSLTAQGRMSRWVLTAIPIFLLAFITAVNPSYMTPLYTTGLGKGLLVVSAVMITTGSLVIKKIVDIKV